MKTVDISLNSIDKVKSFVNDINRFDCAFDLPSNRLLGSKPSKYLFFHLYKQPFLSLPFLNFGCIIASFV